MPGGRLGWVMLVGCLLAAAGGGSQASQPPNILVILADDLGRGDYSAFGTRDLRTPGIDRLFREGTAFDHFYANSPVCSPTRAALLTGRYPDAVGVPGVIRQWPENSWGHLVPGAATLPDELRRAGYDTAMVGKWHLGYEPPNTPLDRGFRSFRGFLGDMMDDYWTHRRGGENFMRRDRQVIDPPGHATDLFTGWACDYVASREGLVQPFFLYLAFNAPHDPIQPPADRVVEVRRREPGISEARARLVSLIEQMDAGIGQVLATLERTGQADNTLVVFTSDNGGVLNYGAGNGPWRGEKQQVYEGGIRTPCAVRWPGRVPAGGRRTSPALTMDLFPTLLAAAGRKSPEVDGVNLLPVLTGAETQLPERDLYFVRREGGPPYGGKTIEAVRRGPWKLLQNSPYAPRELYHLDDDPRETTNLAARAPAVARELGLALEARSQAGGRVPWQPPVPFRLQVDEPEAGDRWAAGSLHAVRWTGLRQGRLAVELSTGAAWEAWATAEAAPGSVLLTVPNRPANGCRIRLRAPSGATAESAGFSIIPSQEVAYRWTSVTGRASFAPRDGAGILSYGDRMWLLGGWNPGDRRSFPRICNNEVWSSDDGADWRLEKPNTFLDRSFDAGKDWEGRHTAGYAVFRNRMWIVGGDVNQGHYHDDVWSSADGKTWEQANRGRPVPWGPRALHQTLVHRERLWVIGGQTVPQFAPAAETYHRDLWTSADGVRWSRIVPREPYWSARGMIGGAAVFRNRIWILGGGTYDTPQRPGREFHNDVWSSADGVRWRRHTAETPWPPRQYHDVAVWDGRLWVMEGYGGHAAPANRNDVWYSSDGENWYEVKATPWRPRHAASVCVHRGALWMVAGNNMESDVWKLARSGTTTPERITTP